MEEHQEKPCHDSSDPKSPDFGDYMSKPPDFGVCVSKPPDFGDCMSTASTISSANSDIDDQDVNSSPIAALGVTKIEVSRGIENEKLKEEVLNARIALLDQNNTILELENKLRVQKLQIKERNQVLLDMTVKFEKVMTDLKDINMAKREEKDNEVAFLKMELKHLSTSLDDEKREKRNIVREKDLAVCSLAKAMEREKKNVQEIVRFAIEVERLKAENLKLSKVKDENLKLDRLLTKIISE